MNINEKKFQGKVVIVELKPNQYQRGVVYDGTFYTIGWVSPDSKEKFEEFVLHAWEEKEFQEVDVVNISSPLEIAVLKALPNKGLEMVSIPMRIEKSWIYKKQKK